MVRRISGHTSYALLIMMTLSLTPEMGLGKSIMLASLIHANREPEPASVEQPLSTQKRPRLTLDSNFRPVNRTHDTKSDEGPSVTLIVAPTSLLAQWKSELDRSSKKGTLKTVLWYGQSRKSLASVVDGGDTDVVVTSYGTLVSEHAKFSKNTSSSEMFQSEFSLSVKSKFQLLRT